MAVNLADPSQEPTDEELQQLSRDAFADVGRKHDEALAKLRVRIATAGDEALERLERERSGDR